MGNGTNLGEQAVGHARALGLPIDWTALATVGLTASTLMLALLAWLQLRSIRDEALRSRTLAACDRYDTDPILDIALRRISGSKLSGRWPERELRLDVKTVLNYLDALAIGIEQGLYLDELARDHMAPIVKAHVKEYLSAEAVLLFGIDPENYQKLTRLCSRWREAPPFFNGGGGRLRRKRRGE